MLLNSVMTNSITSVTLGMMVIVVNAVLMIGTNDEVSQHTVKCDKIKNILQKIMPKEPEHSVWCYSEWDTELGWQGWVWDVGSCFSAVIRQTTVRIDTR